MTCWPILRVSLLWSLELTLTSTGYSTSIPLTQTLPNSVIVPTIPVPPKPVPSSLASSVFCFGVFLATFPVPPKPYLSALAVTISFLASAGASGLLIKGS